MVQIQENESFKGIEGKIRHQATMLLLGSGLVVAAAICLRIEMLNSAAGRVLPRNASEDGKWRISYNPEKFLMTMAAARYRLTNGLAYDAELPVAVMADIKRDIAPQVPRLAAQNSLRGFLGEWGLFQYPLCFGIFAGGMRMASTKWSRFGAAFGKFVAVAAAGFISVAWFRGYVSSLGW